MKIVQLLKGVGLGMLIGLAPCLTAFAEGSKTLILRYAKPPVFGSGTAQDCSSVNGNVIKFLTNTPELSIMCTGSQQINISPNPVNEVTSTVQANWQVYNAPSGRIYGSSAENLNTAVITPPYDSSGNLVTYTYQIGSENGTSGNGTSGSGTFQYQLGNTTSSGSPLTASYNGNTYVFQSCQDDTTDPTDQYIVCLFQYTPST